MRTFGIERERFISNAQGQIVSAIGKLLPRTHKIAHERRVPEDLFGFELFAGQIEDRTLPCYDIVSLREALVANDDMLLGAASELGLIFDHSGFRRINAYRTMAETDGIPPTFSGFSEVMSYITSKGGEKDVWDLVRFKPSTDTVEFRMFGATPSIDEIIGYVNACRDISEI